MNRSEVIKAIAGQQGESAQKVTQIVDSLLEIICTKLAAQEEIQFPNFGKFVPKTRKATTRNSPITGTVLSIPQRLTVTFHPAPALKNRLNEESNGQ